MNMILSYKTELAAICDQKEIIINNKKLCLPMFAMFAMFAN